MAVIYILHQEEKDKFYTGSCLDLKTRLEQHQNKSFAKYTSQYNNWKLFFKIEGLDYQQARKIEAHIKRMKSKTYIRNLKKYPHISEKLISRYRSD